MKLIYLVRHAKAGEFPEASDFDRALTNKGFADATHAGRQLSANGVSVDLIVASPAARTLATANAIAAEISYPEDKLQTERQLYLAHADAMLSVLQEIPDEFETIMLVGHNPGITEFANNLLSIMLVNMPTSAVVKGVLNISTWKTASWSCGKGEMLSL